MKRWLKFGKGLQGSICARQFIGVEKYRLRGRLLLLRFCRGSIAVRGQKDGFYFDGKSFVLEFSRGDSGDGFFVRGHGKTIGRFAQDSKLARNVLGSQPHIDVSIGIIVHKPRIGRDFVSAHWNHGHGFGTACNDHVRSATADSVSCERNRLKSRGAKRLTVMAEGSTGS